MAARDLITCKIRFERCKHNFFKQQKQANETTFCKNQKTVIRMEQN